MSEQRITREEVENGYHLSYGWKALSNPQSIAEYYLRYSEWAAEHGESVLRALLAADDALKPLADGKLVDDEFGIYKIGAQDMAVSATAPMTANVQPTTARTWCNIAGSTNQVDITFKLRM